MTIVYKLKSLLMCTTISLLTACGDGTKEKEPVTSVEPMAFNYQAAIDNTISGIVPGVVLLVEKPNFKFLGSAGVANVEDQTPMQTYHIMPNGSAGKKLTALLVTMLEQEGLLNLDDTIDTWLPDELLSQIENSEQMTLRQLLNHTAGVFDYLDDRIARDYFETVAADPSSLKTDIYALQFALNKPAYFKPGEGFEYSNTGYLLAGLIMDHLLGEHHSVAMRNRIFDPLGMNASHYGGIEKERGDIISGYFTDEDGSVIETKSWYENMGVADGPVVSSVEDMALILKTIVSDESFVSADIRGKLIGQENMFDSGDGLYIGLGVFKSLLNNKEVFHHGGLEIGYSTTNIYIPETQTSITAFFNCGGSAQCENESDKLIQAVLLNEL